MKSPFKFRIGCRGLLGCFLLSVGVAASLRAAEPSFRTDTSRDDKLPWFQLKPGEFPPEGSAHYIAGELIALDHINRTGVLRPDRTDAQRRGDWDLPLPFVLLSYGSISYHGAPAELRDIPIGTHLHGQFYADEPKPKNAKSPKDQRLSLEAAFSRVLKLEDDFSFFSRQQRSWRVDGVQLDAGTLTVAPVGPGLPPTPVKPTVFQVGPYTQVFKGKSIVSLSDLAAGQSLLINLTVCTLKGPGRCTSIWIDDESRQLATAHQIAVHHQFYREHGLAGWIEAVDNKEGIVTVTLFAGFDPRLKEDYPLNDAVTAAVAEDSLRTWDQINDRKSGPITAIDAAAAGPGNSGVQIKFKPALLLEGFRPKRIIRLWPSKWKVDDLPREERLYQ